MLFSLVKMQIILQHLDISPDYLYPTMIRPQAHACDALKAVLLSFENRFSEISDPHHVKCSGCTPGRYY